MKPSFRNDHHLAVRVRGMGELYVRVECSGDERKAAEFFRQVCRLFAGLSNEHAAREFKSCVVLELPGGER